MAFFASSNFCVRSFRWLCILSLFGFVAFAEAQVTGSEIERLLEAGRAEAEKGDFTKALGYFNKAMGYLKQASPKHPLNEVVRREIRVTKGRSLVARYRNRSGLRLVAKDELLPLDQEPREVLVRQRFGTVLAREVWQPKKIAQIGEYVGFGRRLTVLPEGGVDLYLGDESEFSLRSVDAASLALPEDKVFDLHSGSFAISSTNKLNSCTVRSPLSSLQFDLVLMSFSMNEILEKEGLEYQLGWLNQVTQHLKPNGFLVILEPAESQTCNNLQESSRALTESSSQLHKHAPYFNNLPCPLIANKSKYYSHEVRRIFPTQTIQKINTPLRLEIREIKFGMSILGKPKALSFPGKHSPCRLVSPIKKSKGVIFFVGIGADGQEYRYEFQRRNLSKEETKDLLSLERGDVLGLGPGESGKDEKRIRIPSTNDLQLLFAPRPVSESC